MDRSKRMGEGSIPRLLATFSAPAIVGMFAMALYNVVDRIFVGQVVGPMGIAGTTVSFPFMLILMAFGMLVGIGAAALVSIRLGQKKKAEAEQVLGNALVLLIAISAVLTTLGLLFLDSILRVLGASAQVLPFARQYLQIIIAGSVLQGLSFGMNGMIRGEGNPRVAMVTMLIGALLNALLDALFLFQFGWGMRGAAAATITAQGVSALWVLGYFLSGRSLLRLRVQNLRLRRTVYLAIFAIGSPMFGMQLAGAVMNTILNNQLRIYGGDLAISVMGIIYAVAMFVAMPIVGINQGAQPIIGFNFGARRFDRVTKTLQVAIAFASLICVSGFLVVMAAPYAVIRLFSRNDPALLQLGTHAIRICLLMFPVIGFQIIGSGYFQAVGKPKQALILGLSRQVLILIPAVVILPFLFGLNGIWAAIPTADSLSALVTGTWLLFELRSLHRQHAAGLTGSADS